MKNPFLDQDIPAPVKFVAGVFLLTSFLNIAYFLVYVSVNPIAYLALTKAAVGVLFAYGILKMIPVWRNVALILSFLTLVAAPIYLLLILTSPAVMEMFAELTLIDSRPFMLAAIFLGFLFGLAILLPLIRPGVKEAFETKAPATDP